MAPIVEVELSYSEAYDLIKGCKDPDVLNTSHPKVSHEAQKQQPGATRIWGSDVYATGKGRAFRAGGLLNMPTREIPTDKAVLKNLVTCGMRCVAIGSMHVVLALYGYSTFSWAWAAIGWSIFAFCGIFGITLGYHRLLTHKSFKTSKAFEYFVAFVGTQAGQGDPIEWVSTHRYHHLHCDTPLDPHSPYEGFWWSHILWLAGTEHSLLDYANVPDLKNQAFYKLMEFTFFPLLFIVKPYVMYQWGGMAAVCWTCAFPLVWGYHTTFLVNSASHIWGYRPYETGELSTNNWWVALLAFGEGWHNAHHAFPYSARHGLEWYEFDATWILICVLKALGIVWDVQLPSERTKALKRRNPAAAPVEVTAVVLDKSAARKRKA